MDIEGFFKIKHKWEFSWPSGTILGGHNFDNYGSWIMVFLFFYFNHWHLPPAWLLSYGQLERVSLWHRT